MGLNVKPVDLEKLTADAEKYVHGYLIFTAVMWTMMIALYFVMRGLIPTEEPTLARNLIVALFVIVSVAAYIALPFAAVIRPQLQRGVFAFVTAYGVVILFSSLIGCLDPEIGPKPILGFGFLGLMWTCFSLVIWMGTYHQIDLAKKTASA